MFFFSSPTDPPLLKSRDSVDGDSGRIQMMDDDSFLATMTELHDDFNDTCLSGVLKDKLDKTMFYTYTLQYIVRSWNVYSRASTTEVGRMWDKGETTAMANVVG